MNTELPGRQLGFREDGGMGWIIFPFALWTRQGCGENDKDCGLWGLSDYGVSSVILQKTELG